MRMVQLLSVALLLAALLDSNRATAQTIDSTVSRRAAADSGARSFKPGPGTVALQIAAGQAAFALPFWTLGGKRQLEGKEGNYGGVLLAYVTVPLGVWGATNLVHDNSGSLGLAFVGSLLSIGLTALIMPGSPTEFERYMYVSGALVISTAMFYDLSMWLHSD